MKNIRFTTDTGLDFEEVVLVLEHRLRRIRKMAPHRNKRVMCSELQQFASAVQTVESSIRETMSQPPKKETDDE